MQRLPDIIRLDEVRAGDTVDRLLLPALGRRNAELCRINRSSSATTSRDLRWPTRAPLPRRGCAGLRRRNRSTCPHPAGQGRAAYRQPRVVVRDPRGPHRYGLYRSVREALYALCRSIRVRRHRGPLLGNPRILVIGSYHPFSTVEQNRKNRHCRRRQSIGSARARRIPVPAFSRKSLLKIKKGPVRPPFGFGRRVFGRPHVFLRRLRRRRSNLNRLLSLFRGQLPRRTYSCGAFARRLSRGIF